MAEESGTTLSTALLSQNGLSQNGLSQNGYLFALLGAWGGSSPPVPRECAAPSIIWKGWARSVRESAYL